jgi:hypothetical protein
MDFKATDKFIAWANSFSGCDGGNLEGAFWFCGIEYGGNKDPSHLNLTPITVPGHVDDEWRDKSFLKSRYNQNLVKLYKAILSSSESTKQFSKKHKIFGKTSNEFKVNLYPINFPDDGVDNWTEVHYNLTGLLTKRLYQAWCQLHRFQRIREWVEQYSPKVIVCTGSSYFREFLMAFSGPESVFKHNTVNLTGNRKLKWVQSNADKTIVFVTPFLGNRHGLNSNRLLSLCGKKIASICEEQFGKSVWSEVKNA